MQLFSAEQYQPDLQQRFVTLRNSLLRLLPYARIEHVGSSAVPGAISKGDLDMAVVVPLAQHAATVQTLLAQGYAEQADTLRTEALCMLNAGAEMPEHALQIVAAGSEFEDFMRFRDALLADPALVQQYNAVKQAASDLPAEAYRAAKSRFIESVLQRMLASTEQGHSA